MSLQEVDPASGAFLERAQHLIERGEAEQALAVLAQAHERDPQNARLRSSLGLCVGLVDRDFTKALELCDSAVKQEFFNPELYLNLAKLHLAFGLKEDGLRHLRRGRMIDPANGAIRAEFDKLGSRRGPLLRFLPRDHLFNRWFGRARHRIATAA